MTAICTETGDLRRAFAIGVSAHVMTFYVDTNRLLGAVPVPSPGLSAYVRQELASAPTNDPEAA